MLPYDKSQERNTSLTCYYPNISKFLQKFKKHLKIIQNESSGSLSLRWSLILPLPSNHKTKSKGQAWWGVGSFCNDKGRSHQRHQGADEGWICVYFQRILEHKSSSWIHVRGDSGPHELLCSKGCHWLGHLLGTFTLFWMSLLWSIQSSSSAPEHVEHPTGGDYHLIKDGQDFRRERKLPRDAVNVPRTEAPPPWINQMLSSHLWEVSELYWAGSYPKTFDEKNSKTLQPVEPKC